MTAEEIHEKLAQYVGSCLLSARVIQQQQENLTDAKGMSNAIRNMRKNLNLAKELLDVVEQEKTPLSNDVLKGLLKDLNRALSILPEEDEEQALLPFILEELKKPEYDNICYEQLKNEGGEQYKSVINIARARMAEAITEPFQLTISEKNIKKVLFPLDKVNTNIWSLLTTMDKDGQLTFAVEKRGSKRPVDIICGLDFSALETQPGLAVVKKLTAFDKRVYIAAAAVYSAGYEITTIAQIYMAMGGSGHPSQAMRDKINKSLTKMTVAHIYLDNISEVNAKYNVPRFRYDGALLPMERVSAIVNGQETDTAIHFFREAPLITFARERPQITTIPRQLLESPLSLTENNLLIDDYLIREISFMKKPNSKISRKMLFETIFEKTGIKDRKSKARAKDKIKRYLDYYKSYDKEKPFIKDYFIDDNETFVEIIL